MTNARDWAGAQAVFDEYMAYRRTVPKDEVYGSYTQWFKRTRHTKKIQDQGICPQFGKCYHTRNCVGKATCGFADPMYNTVTTEQ